MKLYQRWFVRAVIGWFVAPIIYSASTWMDEQPGFQHLHWCFDIWAWLGLVFAGVSTLGAIAIFMSGHIDNGGKHCE